MKGSVFLSFLLIWRIYLNNKPPKERVLFCVCYGFRVSGGVIRKGGGERGRESSARVCKEMVQRFTRASRVAYF